MVPVCESAHTVDREHLSTHQVLGLGSPARVGVSDLEAFPNCPVDGVSAGDPEVGSGRSP